ncbi:hypothetical protein [Serpentinicella alkaliphila]|uniref:Type 4 fimbrial biogenesis protein PilX N-terminal domain-containing protein n=1 Tax=Serpentinicella alkaliphila TaxID=1734049 RepID=A0A4R2TNN4_9FIRM|nr:hypothetical protein [Serpentinicella alkaliphila]QUH26654.1 hypothetical protein HZR23_13600 [Serpentinicella alkaliphila]TCQ02875.1 hypothetical protein EDD79_10124 [Serpentinicella alkaliphila]
MRREKRKITGSIVLTTIIICLLVTIIVVTFYNLVYENHISVQSNVNGIRAYYISESAIDVLYNDINKVCEKAIEKYFEELFNYKIYYINLEGGVDYCPPDFQNILKTNILLNISSFNRTVNNPFSSYVHDHSYKITVDYVVSYNIIKADIIGRYLHARKPITVEFDLPTEIFDGVDEFGLPKLKIKPLKLIKIYQNLTI